jgi:hypothetical protein
MASVVAASAMSSRTSVAMEWASASLLSDDDEDACSCCGAVVVADEVLSSPYRRDLEPSLPIVS